MKKTIRRLMLEKLKFHQPEERLEKSFKIKQKLFKLPEFQYAQTIAFFVGLQHEVETLPMIEEALKLTKRIVLPVSDFNSNVMQFSEINNITDLIETEKGLLEPNYEKIVPIEAIDLFIVPGIAFDFQGARIGKGKGFYDRALKKAKQATFIALAFDFQVIERIPKEEHDINVNIIVTEKRVIRCERKT